jgi:hypothetical protein
MMLNFIQEKDNNIVATKEIAIMISISKQK